MTVVINKMKETYKKGLCAPFCFGIIVVEGFAELPGMGRICRREKSRCIQLDFFLQIITILGDIEGEKCRLYK